MIITRIISIRSSIFKSLQVFLLIGCFYIDRKNLFDILFRLGTAINIGESKYWIGNLIIAFLLYLMKITEDHNLPSSIVVNT